MNKIIIELQQNIDCLEKTVDAAQKEIIELKDKVINRQTHINTLRQDLNKAQDKLQKKSNLLSESLAKIGRRNMQIKDLKETLSKFADLPLEKIDQLVKNSKCQF